MESTPETTGAVTTATAVTAPGPGPGGSSGHFAAPYGHSCTNCVRAKDRCFYRLDGTGCERCVRSDKECIQTVPVRRLRGRPNQRAGETPLDPATLFQNLYGPASNSNGASAGTSLRATPATPALPDLSSLSQQRRLLPELPPILPRPSPRFPSHLLPRLPARLLPLLLPRLQLDPQPRPLRPLRPRPQELGAVSSRTPLPTEPRDVLHLPPGIAPTADEAEQALESFRRMMLPFFPFVDLPASLTAQQLRATKPYLWLAIMAVTCEGIEPALQQARSTHLRGLFAQHVACKSEKTLDLLQALLAFIGWVHYASKHDRPTLSVMLQHAISLVYDLGLHTASSEKLMSAFVQEQREHFGASGPAASSDVLEAPSPTPDERRAALACFLVSSRAAQSLMHANTLRWTTRLDEHLTWLSGWSTSPLDQVLVTQVRFQRVTDYITQGAWRSDNIDDPLGDDNYDIKNNSDGGPRVMPPNVVHMVAARMDRLVARIPRHVSLYQAVREAVYAADMIVRAATVMPVVAPLMSMTTVALVAARSCADPCMTSLTPHQRLSGVTPSSVGKRHANADKGKRRADADKGKRRADANANGDADMDADVDPPADHARAAVERCAALDSCAESISNYWTFIQHISNLRAAVLPFAYFANFTHCMVLLYGLSLVDEPGWDRAGARDPLYILDMLDALILQLYDAPHTAVSDMQGGIDVVARCADLLLHVRELWAADPRHARPHHALRQGTKRNLNGEAIGKEREQGQERNKRRQKRSEQRQQPAQPLLVPRAIPIWALVTVTPSHPIIKMAMGDPLGPPDAPLRFGRSAFMPDLLLALELLLADNDIFWDMFLPPGGAHTMPM